ncbi:hypothetical protein HN954_03470 [bacterium]|nr:hypothetical protein [bacterium]MBT6832237.1 hypothetical protein [bacterium]MBT6996462.1 hypothetical protein [bacterium]MBT7772291.1 hypothetical protein [bacterium]
MRKLFLTFVSFIIFLPLSVDAILDEPIRTEDSVVVDTGDIFENGVLADSAGTIFLEFSKNTRVVYASDSILFSGEILPPQTIEIPDQAPRTRMDELVTFELISDGGDDLKFVDRFDVMHPRNRLKLQYTDPESLERSAWVKLIFPIENKFVRTPKMWRYLGEDFGWKRIGGTFEPSSTEEIWLFSVTVPGTGVFSVFDENPLPKTFATDWEIENPATEDPFLSGESEGNFVEGDVVPFDEMDNAPLFSEDEELPESDIPAISVPQVEKVETPENSAELVPEIEALVDETFGAENNPDATLPQSGPVGELETTNWVMPILLAFIFGILGMSIFLALRKKKTHRA